MSQVIPLRVVDPRSHETIQVLRAVLARAERGEVVGLVMSFKQRTGHEDVAYTGTYRDRPDEAVAASMRMSVLMNQSERQY